MILEAQPDIEVVGEAGDGARGACARWPALRPDVVLMDVRMPGMDGVEATRRIVAAGRRARVLILTTFDLDEYAFAALRAGASGFLLKDVPPAELAGGDPGGRRRRRRRRAADHPPAARPRSPHQLPDAGAASRRATRRSPRSPSASARCSRVARGLTQRRDRRPAASCRRRR